MINDKNDVRFPVGAGSHYPKDAAELQRFIRESLDRSTPHLNENLKLKAIIVPGVAYDYSKIALSYAYTQVQQIWDEVFILSDPVLHEIGQICFDTSRIWKTPLGDIELSHRMDQIVRGDDNGKDIMVYDSQKFEGEVGIELQLPYLQLLLGDSFRMIPIMLGGVSPRVASKLLDSYIDPDDLIIAVSNMSEGFPLDYAKELDRVTSDTITSLDLESISSDTLSVSSPTSVLTMMNFASKHGWKVEELHLDHVQVSEGREDSYIGIASYAFLG